MADITKNIIFRIGSELGPGGLASLKAGYDMFMQIAQGVAQAVSAMESYIDMQQQLKIDISKVDYAVRGLVTSMGLVQSANKLSEAKVKVTAEQFAALAKNAAAFSDAIGVSPAQALDQLVTGLISGSEKGLRPFGLNLSDVTSRTEKQTKAIEQLTDRAKDLSPSLGNSTEKLGAITDGFKTMWATVWGRITSEGNVVGEFFNSWAFGLNETIKTFEEMNKADQLGKFAERIARVRKEIQLAQREGWTEAVAEWQAVMDQLLIESGAKPKAVEYEDQGPSPELLAEIAYERNTAAPRRGGGGGGTGAADMTFSEEEAEAGRLAYVESLTGGPAKDMLAANVDEQMELLREQSRMIQVEQKDRFVSWQENLANERAEFEKNYAEQAAIRIRYAEYETEMIGARKISEFEFMLGVDQRYVNESARIWRSGLQGKMATMGVFFNALSQLMTVKNKAMFKVGKAAAIAEGFVNTYLGAIKAYQSMAGIPYVGPALGIIAAAAITAAGIANINRIRSMEYGQEGGGGGRESPSIGMGGGEGALPSSQPGGGGYNGPPQQQEQKLVIEINMGDSALFLDAVVDQNDKASQTGRRYFARAR